VAPATKVKQEKVAMTVIIFFIEINFPSNLDFLNDSGRLRAFGVPLTFRRKTT